tara:strand:+ start:33407 stop:34168 length:762 start_codon:yes stop_codon:yes gene_type:complete
MEAFYSIIYYRPNSLTDELLAMGILASGGEGPFIHLSRRRSDLLKKTIHANQYVSIQRHLKNLVRSVNDDRTSTNELLLFDPNYSKERLAALSQRTKGAIQYSEPITINEWLNESFFETLVQSFLGDRSKSGTNRRPVFHLKWKAFYRSNRFSSWDKDVTAASINESTIPIKIDLYSSENKILIKGMDLDLKEGTVNKRWNEICLLAEVFGDHKVKVVHPAPRKASGKNLLESMKNTVQNIDFINFTQFKENS